SAGGSATPPGATPNGASEVAVVTPSPREERESGLRTATIQSSRGVPWELEADQVEWTEGTRRARALEVRFSLHHPERKRSTRVTARGAGVDVDAERVEFEGSVTVEGPDGEALTVNHLVWDGKAKLFYGDRGVRLVRGHSVLEGDRLIASPDLSRFEIVGGVKGSMSLEGQES
ncbi:MAG: LPS export ABC transporter periplasmic protein LptC, partial [Candidatus Eremiobacterota bacterium]